MEQSISSFKPNFDGFSLLKRQKGVSLFVNKAYDLLSVQNQLKQMGLVTQHFLSVVRHHSKLTPVSSPIIVLKWSSNKVSFE
jgi:hypothetical protein